MDIMKDTRHLWILATCLMMGTQTGNSPHLVQA